MANRFSVPGGSSSPPSTPDRNSRNEGGASNPFNFSNTFNPSTTPAGPPPSSAASFTPAGAPSASYLGSSIMRGVTGASKPTPSFGSSGYGSSEKKTLFKKSSHGHISKRNTPLGRSIRGSQPARPSRLSQQIEMDDDEEEDESEEDDEEEQQQQPLPSRHTGAFGVPQDDYDDEDDEEEDQEDAEGEEEDDYQGYEAEEQDHQYADRDVDPDADADADMWLNMDRPQQGVQDENAMIEESDLLQFTTPAVTDRIRKEAEDLHRASMIKSGNQSFAPKYAGVAKDIYQHQSSAELTEPPELILNTENWINRLYDDGVGTADDEGKLDDTLGQVATKVLNIWNDYEEQLPQSDLEHAAEIGPGPHASPFEKANYLANLALQIHHVRGTNEGQSGMAALPAVLFSWLADYHNLYPTQVQDVLRYRPSPACHSLFWQTTFIAILRGRVNDAYTLLEKAGFGQIRKGASGQVAYSDKALEHINRAVGETLQMMGICPAIEDNWEIFGSDWTMFRVRAQSALEHLRRFAEGKEAAATLNESESSFSGRETMAGMARKAESKVPWEIYENLNIIFEIMLGSQSFIIEAAQDWCEATVGLFGWWDDRRTTDEGGQLGRSQLIAFGTAHRPAASDASSYFDRLARSFHTTVESEFEVNVMSYVEVGMASIFEGNAEGLVGILRGWSLPIASAVAEIASLGKWLPPHMPPGLLEDLDIDDMRVLGVDPDEPDDIYGVKDNTLLEYARALTEYDEISSVKSKTGVTRDGWEVSINVLGRMDNPERSEEIVGLLVGNLTQSLDAGSGETVEKLWRILNELGMIPFAEEVVETYGNILAEQSHRYGEAMWYYALAHRPNKVREVMNLLMSYSLIQSVAYPPTKDLDPHLHRLLNERSKTLELFAKQDLEAAELLGKMLSGYASLRQFYHLRDDPETHNSKQQAITALIGVIASSDDNIRGGLLDQSRDGIVSEDFLLALLGEALLFVSDPDAASNGQHQPHWNPRASAAVVNQSQIDTLLKAVEDLETVGPRVYNSADEFLQVVLASAPGGLKGSTPADLLRRSTAGNAALSGTSVLASQLQKSLSGNSAAGLGRLQNVIRKWDWRTRMMAGAKGDDVIRRMRIGLARDQAGLWLAEADGAIW